jgi:hypothetical protein
MGKATACMVGGANMLAYFPAPPLCQFVDEDLMLEMGAIVFPDFVQRHRGANGLRLKLEGDYRDGLLGKTAADQCQVLLGIVRAWHPLAGQRVDEVRPGIGAGPIRDEHGSQIVTLGIVIDYVSKVAAEVEAYARDAKLALQRSRNLREALWLHGGRDRTAAAVYMIYEDARMEFGGPKQITAALEVSGKALESFRSSAVNLAPVDGGRHAKRSGTPKWGLDTQLTFISRFLKSWIRYEARATAAGG